MYVKIILPLKLIATKPNPLSTAENINFIFKNRFSRRPRPQLDTSRALIWSSFYPPSLPLTLVWKYAAKTRDFTRLYHKEVSTNIIRKVRKNYKSHRRVFDFNKETDLDAFNSVPWKEIDVELVQNRENPE